MNVSRKPTMRYMQQDPSLRIKTNDHGWVNECFDKAQNETHAPSPQPAHRSKGSDLGQWMRPGRQKRDTRIKSAACAQRKVSRLGQWLPPESPKRDIRTECAACAQEQGGGGVHCWTSVNHFEHHKTITAKAPQSDTQKKVDGGPWLDQCQSL